MTWFRIDDGFWSHPKVVGLSDSAIALWTRAGAYACQHLTDGVIAAPVLRLVGEKDAAEELIGAGLWEKVPGGYAFHDWAEYQETSTAVKDRRAAARDRQRKSRAAREAKKAATQSGSGEATAPVTPVSHVTDDVTSQEVSEKFSSPDPTVGRVGTTSLPSLPLVADATREEPPRPSATTDRAPARISGELVPTRPPRGGREVAERWNATAHSPEAHAIVRQYEKHSKTPVPGKVLADIAQRVDDCLASGLEPDQIARGLIAWSESPVGATSQIPAFVHKAAGTQRTRGRGKPSAAAGDAIALAQEMIAKGMTRG